MSDTGREHHRREALLGADPMRLQGARRPLVSFEFFPPKTTDMEAKLWQAVKRLEPLAPRFVSVTYGAGGSTRERTHATVVRIRCETPLEPAAHLTCIGATREEIDAVAEHYWEAGIRHVVALRGDPPRENGSYSPHPGGYAYAADLVAGLKRVADFEVTVGAFRRRIRRRSAPRRISTISSARSTPVPRARSRNSSSTPRSICASSSGRAPAGSWCRSCQASCPSPTWRRRANSPRNAAPRCRRG
jgi:hypothetical protein